MHSYIKPNLYLILLGIQTACCFILDSSQGSGHTGGWTDWRCEKQGELCFKSRTCYTTADFNCSKISEVTVTNCPCVAEWSSWGEWTCRQDQSVCLNIRYRTCINGSRKNGCSDLHGKDFETFPCEKDNICKSGWSDWRCEKQGEICFKSRRCYATADFNCSKTSEVAVTNCPCVAEWSHWGGWTCHLDQVLCLKIRQRTCISGFEENDCLKLQGDHYETTICDRSCNATSTTELLSTSKPPASLTTATTAGVHWLEWSDWKCKTVNHICLMSRTRNCSTHTVDDCEIKLGGVYFNTELCRAEICTGPSPMFSSSTARQLSSTPSVYLISQTGYQTSAVLNTIKTSVAPTTPYTYWLEWTGWECKNVTICMMSRSRNCSTYNPDDCEKTLGKGHFHVEPCRKEICPVSWSDWSTWSCKIEKDGTCNMTRSRKCSTGPDADCGFSSLEHQPCDDVTCPELKKLGNLGYCKDFVYSSCLDAESCKNPSILLMCLADAHVASKICPKACGCCHVDPQWTSWSDWRCERTHSMCRMKQIRTCSTGNTTDCKGVSEREAVCDESICPEPKWESWSTWKCQLRPNNTCRMSRSRICSTGTLCIGQSHEEDDCSSTECPDFVGFKVDCSLHNTKSHGCIDGAGCHFFENDPKLVCVAEAVACPVTCGCCRV